MNKTYLKYKTKYPNLYGGVKINVKTNFKDNNSSDIYQVDIDNTQVIVKNFPQMVIDQINTNYNLKYDVNKYTIIFNGKRLNNNEEFDIGKIDKDVHPLLLVENITYEMNAVDLLNDINILYNRKNNIEALLKLINNNDIQKIREKKKQIFDRHDEMIEEMKKITLDSGINLFDLMIAGMNRLMGDETFFKILYDKWLPNATKKRNTEEEIKDFLDKVNKNSWINFVSIDPSIKRKSYYYDTENNKKEGTINYTFDVGEFTDILDVSVYKPVGYCQDGYLYPEIQEKFKSDDYYITESNGGEKEINKFTHLQVAYIPAVQEFIELNKNFEFIGKTLGNYNVIELLDKMANASFITGTQGNVFYGLFSDKNVKYVIVTDDQTKLFKCLKKENNRHSCIKKLTKQDYPLIAYSNY